MRGLFNGEPNPLQEVFRTTIHPDTEGKDTMSDGDAAHQDDRSDRDEDLAQTLPPTTPPDDEATSSMTEQEDRMLGQLADVLGFVLAARPERVEDGMLALAPPPFRDHVRDVREALATFGQVMSCRSVAPPSVEVRARLIGTIARRMPRRALVIIDMIHDHLDEGALLEVPRARAVVPALKERVKDARARGIPIVYVVDEHDPDDPDLDAWGTHAVKGTKGTEVWDEIAPLPGDHVVKKPSYSAFFKSDLDHVLQDLNVDTLVLTGCLTEIGIMATATDAMQRGFAIEVPPDSQAGSSPMAEQATMGILRVMAPFGPARKARLDRVALAA